MIDMCVIVDFWRGNCRSCGDWGSVGDCSSLSSDVYNAGSKINE